MRALLLLLIAAMALTTAGFAARQPVVRVDAAHDATTGRKAEYRVPPSSALVLDGSGYGYNIPSQLRKRGIKAPNKLNVLIDRDHAYFVNWRKGRIVLDRGSLKPMPGRRPFEGFKAGQKVVIGVGLGLQSRGEMKFFPFWAGVVNVR